MKASCSYIVKAIRYRCASPALARTGPASASFPCPVRWYSSEADHSAEVKDDDDVSGFTQRNSNRTKLAFSGKGKEKARRGIDTILIDRRKFVQETALASQKDIEESEEWKKINARYPGLKTKQISLAALLHDVIQKSNKAKSRLSPGEVFAVHSSILKADREAQSQADLERRFQCSSVAYMIMLKYAHRLRDSKYLKIIAKEAINWKHAQSRDRPLDRKRNRFVHPRVAAASELSRLCRNLFVSMAIHQRVKISNGTEQVLPGIQFPTSAPTVRRGDDAMTISRMLRQRVGGIKMATIETADGGKEKYFKFRKDAQSSSYPMTHQSRRVRWINRMMERGRMSEVMKQTILAPDAAAAASFGPKSPPEARKTFDASTSVVASTSIEGDLTVARRSEVMEVLVSALNDNQIRNQHLQALIKSYEKWQTELSKRLTSRRKMIQILRQFQLHSDVVDAKTVEAIRNFIPTWLVLTFLRLQIESGEPKRAEKMVELYLKSLSSVYNERPLKEVIPIEQHRVHSVTSPLIPPDGSSLLNGMLRAHLTGGAGDCFERMILLLDKWTIEGQGFSDAIVVSSKEQKSKDLEVNDDFALKSCLVPNDGTVLLLLQALRTRKRNKIWGIRLVKEMWTRWGIVGFRDEERQGSSGPLKHQSLKMPLQAMSTLLKWVTMESNRRMRKQLIFQVLTMERVWREKAFDNNRTWIGATIEAKIAWNQIKEKANSSLDLEKQERQDPKGSKRHINVDEGKAKAIESKKEL